MTFRLHQLVSKPFPFLGLMVNEGASSSSNDRKVNGKVLTRNIFLQLQQHTQQVLCEQHQTIANLLVREPNHGYTNQPIHRLIPKYNNILIFARIMRKVDFIV
jgi:hypothetical protein